MGCPPHGSGWAKALLEVELGFVKCCILLCERTVNVNVSTRDNYGLIQTLDWGPVWLQY